MNYNIIIIHCLYDIFISGLRTQLNVIHRCGDVGTSLWRVLLFLNHNQFSTCKSICHVIHITQKIYHFPHKFICYFVWWDGKKIPPSLILFGISSWMFSLIVFSALILGVHYPSLASLCSQKVVESERGFLMSTVGSGSYLGWVKCYVTTGGGMVGMGWESLARKSLLWVHWKAGSSMIPQSLVIPVSV